jgi:adenylate kinase family enzyme
MVATDALAPAVGELGAFAIPGAPPPAALVAHRVALVERVRTLLALRAGGPDADVLRVRRAAARLGRLSAEHRFPFDQMADALALDELDRNTLALVVAPHLDPTIREDIRRLRHDQARAYVDAGLCLTLFAPAPAEALAAIERFRPGGLLCQSGLCDYARPRLSYVPSQQEMEIVPTARLLGLLAGRLVLDPELCELARLAAARADDAVGILGADDAATLGFSARVTCGTLAERSAGRICIEGPEGVGKTAVASALAAAAGFDFMLVVDVPLLRASAGLPALFARLEREARLQNALIVLRRVDAAGERAALLRCLVERLGCAVAATTAAPEQVLGRGAIRFMVRRPDRALRRRAWEIELARQGLGGAVLHAGQLAADLPLARPGIARATAVAAETGQRSGTALERIGRLQLGGGLARLAQRSRARARLDDLVLTDDTRRAVTEIITACRNRAALLASLDGGGALARGIVALFNGPPGTGKTLSATAIASELELPLYRVDVSTLVDRYVGETEKNLTLLFEEAATDHAGLLFDEADSLFAKRVDVKDSTDRYANMQVNVLLNLIDDYEGLVIMTTNLKRSLDQALLRRVAYKVDFEMPEPAERAALWSCHLAPLRCTQGTDLDGLAREFAVAGGEIRNAVTRAALQVGAGGEITMDILRTAMRSELRARGSVVAGS